MTARHGSVLTFNAGSSSIKFAVYEQAPRLRRSLSGLVDRLGLGGTVLSTTTADGESAEEPVDAADAHAATAYLLDWLDERDVFASVVGIGHRVVHGFGHTEPTRITRELLAQLHRATPYAPDHLPREIALIETLATRHAHLPQVACFDTAFHAHMPAVATLLPIPRRYYDGGVRRYGFHGLSYEFLMDELARLAGPESASGRVVLAHLGHGASMAAVKGGRSLDTSMGFTPAAGLVMSTRSGDLDPGLVTYLARTEQMTATAFDHMVTKESGLLGVSELSPDMRDLLARETSDRRAAEAVALFCYQARKWIGAFAAALGGLDTIVFSAGIGERSAPIRSRICEGLAFLGVELDEARNVAHAAVISRASSRVTVRVIPTNEELMIARAVVLTLGMAHQPEEREA